MSLKNDCGCRIHYGAGKGGNKILYCSVHAAAFDLLEVVKDAKQEAWDSAHSSGDPDDLEYMTSNALLYRTAKAALLKAEGK